MFCYVYVVYSYLVYLYIGSTQYTKWAGISYYVYWVLPIYRMKMSLGILEVLLRLCIFVLQIYVFYFFAYSY